MKPFLVMNFINNINDLNPKYRIKKIYDYFLKREGHLLKTSHSNSGCLPTPF